MTDIEIVLFAASDARADASRGERPRQANWMEAIGSKRRSTRGHGSLTERVHVYCPIWHRESVRGVNSAAFRAKFCKGPP